MMSRTLLAERRVPALDLIRGAALLGLCVINMRPFLATPSSSADVAAYHIADILFLDKMYPLFSLVFGVGAAIQFGTWRRLQLGVIAKGTSRFAVLYVLGLCFYILVDTNYILMTYACAGVFLLFMWKLSSRVIVVTALTTLMAGTMAPLSSTAMFVTTGHPDVSREQQPEMQGERPLPQTRVTFLQASVHRATIYWSQWTITPPDRLLHTLGMALLGLWLARQRAWQFTSSKSGRLVARKLPDILLVLIFVNVLVATATSVVTSPVALAAARSAAIGFGTTQAVAYAAGLIAWIESSSVPSLLNVISAAGRASLSNFVTQYIVFVGLFASYGARYGGHLSTLEGIALAVAIWTAQLFISEWWLQHFAHGPLEWIWRSVSSGAWLKMRHHTADSVPV